MNLTQAEIAQFYKIWYELIWGINQKRGIVPKFIKPVYGMRVNEQPFFIVRAQLWDNPQWIDEFLRDYDYGALNEAERGTLADWRKNFIKGRFIVMRHLAKYSIFMSAENTGELYGVCGISNPIKDVARYDVPFMVETVLLPFGDRIIYDSFLSAFNVSFGKGIRSEFKSAFDEGKEKIGIIERIGEPPVLAKPPGKKLSAQEPEMPGVDTKGANVPKAMAARYVEIAGIIESFCAEKLDAEYKEICLSALAKLCRKRPSPLVSGKARTWASGIIYAIGSSNFIFDKSQPIHMTSAELAEWFGLSKSTVGNKAAEITKLLDLSYLNPEFQLKRLIDSNPAIWYLKVNGYLVDIRRMPREAQEEAFRKGFIPYIPADRIE